MPPAAQVVGMAGNMLAGTSHGLLLLSAALPPATQAADIARSVLKGTTRESSSLLSVALPPAAARIAGQVLKDTTRQLSSVLVAAIAPPSPPLLSDHNTDGFLQSSKAK